MHFPSALKILVFSSLPRISKIVLGVIAVVGQPANTCEAHCSRQ
jgi:hypothetical protein